MFLFQRITVLFSTKGAVFDDCRAAIFAAVSFHCGQDGRPTIFFRERDAGDAEASNEEAPLG